MTDLAPFVRYARARIRAALGGPPATAPEGPEARAPGACFVTLHWPDGALQGCIGSLEPYRPLVDDVGEHALDAAFRDPRNRSLHRDDVATLHVEVSVLSPRAPIAFGSEREARAALRPGVDGVVLAWRDHRGTFLPQVWEELPDPRAFLDALKEKAGLARTFWSDDVRLERYTVEKLHQTRDGAPFVA